MSKIDIAIAIVLFYGAFRGYRQGFLMGVVSLLAFILAIFLGFKFMGEGMVILQQKFNADASVLPYISFFVIFILVVIGVNWLGKLIRNSIEKGFLGRLDESMGALLGCFKFAFLMSIVFWILDSMKYAPGAKWTEGSFLYPFIAHLGPDMAGWLAEFVPFFREIFRQF
ncbi:MAG: CvpA family protein [Flammeovirgaceae bacterium]|nr:CvpA family protein [Flammeovirgaceae bacterium]